MKSYAIFYDIRGKTMKLNLRLPVFAAFILLTRACLSTPVPTEPPISTVSISPSATATALPAQLAGLKIACILNDNVWLWDGAAPARQLTSDGDAAQVKISDDGAVIVYQRGQSLWAVNADGTSPRLLVDVVSYGIPILPELGAGLTLFLGQFEFQPNTHWVYFTTAWGGEKPIIQSRDLHRVNADAPTPQMLLDRDGGTVTFSTDGNLLALASLTSIKVVHADGRGLVTALSYPIISTMVDYIPQVVWLSDGTGFYTVIPNDDGGKSKYLFVSAGGNFSAQLAEYNGLIPPIISRDGLKVAYVDHIADSFNLHVIEASTTDTIIASYEGAPFLVPWSWSPDSKLVTFSNAHPMLLLTAGIGIPPSPLTEAITPYSLRWVSADHFIFFREGELLIGQIENPNTIHIASGFSNQADTRYYDFTISSPP
jgi:hypothetical protein